MANVLSTVPNDPQTRLRALFFLISGVSILSLQDVIMKWLSSFFSVHEILLIRSFFALIFLIGLAYITGGIQSLQTRRYKVHLLRATLIFIAYTSFYLSLAALPLAETVTLFYSSPFFIAVLSPFLLQAKVSVRSWATVVIRFSGVILLLNPKVGNFNPAALLAILSAFCYAVASIITKRLGQTDSGLSLALYPNIIYILCSGIIGVLLGNNTINTHAHPSLIFLLRPWQIPLSHDWPLLILLGLMTAVGFYCLSQAYRMAEPASIAPLEYIAVPLSVLWGYLFWNEALPLRSYVAMLLIIGSGLYIFGYDSNFGKKYLIYLFKTKIRR